MANSRYDFHKEEEHITEPRFNRGSYIIVRIDGDKFHRFCSEHKFYKPNDKRCLDLMVSSAKELMRTYKNHIALAYGHSDEFSFLVRSTSDLLSRRVYKITSMLPVIFANHFNKSWKDFFGDEIVQKYFACFDARPKEYPNYKSVIDYFRWRQVDCHINNLYNTTLHALSGQYMRYETDSDETSEHQTKPVKVTNISEWVKDTSKFHTTASATKILSTTKSADKHDILYLDYKINYNNEPEQFKKGTIVVDTKFCRSNKDGDSIDSIKHFHVDLFKPQFWDQYRDIFDDYVEALAIK